MMQYKYIRGRNIETRITLTIIKTNNIQLLRSDVKGRRVNLIGIAADIKILNKTIFLT